MPSPAGLLNYFFSTVAAEAPEALPAVVAAEVSPSTDGATTAVCGATGAATVGEVCVVTAGADTSTTGVVVVVEPAAGVEVLLVQPTNIIAATAVITSVFILFSFSILEFGLLDRTSGTAWHRNRYLF